MHTSKLTAITVLFIASLLSSYNVSAQGEKGNGRTIKEGGAGSSGGISPTSNSRNEGNGSTSGGRTKSVLEGVRQPGGRYTMNEGGATTGGGRMSTYLLPMFDGGQGLLASASLALLEGGSTSGGGRSNGEGGSSSTGGSWGLSLRPSIRPVKDYGGRGMPSVQASKIATTRSLLPEGGTGSSGGIFLAPQNHKKHQFITSLHPLLEGGGHSGGNNGLIEGGGVQGGGYAVGALLRYSMISPGCDSRDFSSCSKKFAARTAPLSYAEGGSHSEGGSGLTIQ